jgi:hypothetical protein
VVVADNPLLRFSSDSSFSVGGWINFADVTTTQVVVTKYSNRAHSFVWAVSLSAGRLHFLVSDQMYFNYVASSPTPLLPSRWYAFVATYDGSVARLYLDGVFQGEAAYGGVPTLGDDTMPLRIGNQRVGDEGYFDPYWLNGALDDVAVYRTALSASEIASGFYSDAATIFGDNFETGDASKWDIWPSPVFPKLDTTTSDPHGGAYSVHPVFDVALMKKEFAPVSTGVVEASWYMKQTAVESNSYFRVALGSSLATHPANEIYMDFMKGSIQTAYGTVSLPQTIQAVTPGVWYKLAIRYAFATSTATYYVDDVQVDQATFAIPSLDYVWVGDGSSSSGMGDTFIESVADSVYLDDIVLRRLSP